VLNYGSIDHGTPGCRPRGNIATAPDLPSQSMTTSGFEQALGDLAASLGDPTRRGIFVTACDSAEPVTAGRIADLFGIHPNVARHHLERLVKDGYLRVGGRPSSGIRRAGAGRPAKTYLSTEKRIAVTYPNLRQDLLAMLLAEVVQSLAPERAPQAAEETGRRYGLELAAAVGMPDQAGFPEALDAVARALTGIGFSVSTDEGRERVIADHCPFSGSAAPNPEVFCRLHMGIVAGLFEAACGKRQPTQLCTRHLQALADEAG
jgi:predicted ArsR family transcriptional regulator